MTADAKNFPPPWKLYGEGFLIPFLSDKKRNLEQGFIRPEDKNNFVGGLGACMLLNYATSNIGPHQELLFIPGDFKHKGKTYKKITKSYVSSHDLIKVSKSNWGIEREFASFEWLTKNNTSDIRVAFDDKLILEAKIHKRFLYFPITTKLFPVHFLQKAEDCYLHTRFSGHGKAKVATIQNFETNPDYFPNIKKAGILRFAFGIDQMHTNFPAADKFSF